MTLFSIIIPTYNAKRYVEKCINNLNKLDYPKSKYEVLFIDDCSTDNTSEILAKVQSTNNHVRTFKTDENEGPGGARNLGIKNSKGEWLIFLDVDDFLTNESLLRLEEEITDSSNFCLPDIISFNWKYYENSAFTPLTSHQGRHDLDKLKAHKIDRIRQYLSFLMDHSVIYTLFNKTFLLKNNILFSKGLHEDVDFMLYTYWHADYSKVINDIIYQKNSRHGSIINSITSDHIHDFFSSYERIYDFLIYQNKFIEFKMDLFKGIIALISSRIREVIRLEPTSKKRLLLIKEIYECSQKILTNNNIPIKLDEFYDKTLYSMICREFFSIYQNNDMSDIEKERAITTFVSDVANKRWSCHDLHHAVFLRPNKINTCCKRFFVENQIRGDVTIIDRGKHEGGISTQEIVDAKKNLFLSINQGKQTDCDGCPFLEFKEWPNIESATFNTLSLEYHSICNLKCSYCSDEYYGGKKPNYNVSNLINELVLTEKINNGTTIIWGGGEPVLSPNFSSIVALLNRSLPKSRFRIITNAVKHSHVVEDLLRQGRANLFTSIDAGTREAYKIIRGKDTLERSLRNLQLYSSPNPSMVTIKFIFTDGNRTELEVDKFVKLIVKYSLTKCTIQISADFKEETISYDTLMLVLIMYGKLKKEGIQLVFIDELVRHRIDRNYLEKNIDKFYAEISKRGLDNFIANPIAYPEVILYGAGEQSRLLINDSLFFTRAKIPMIIDSTPEKQKKSYYGAKVYSPEKLSHTNFPVIISANQNYSNVYDEFMKFCGKPERIITKLVI